jgi:hypothetical protein
MKRLRFLLCELVMVKEFERSGVRFQYPENWKIETEENDTGWSATLFSPATAFLMVSLQGGADSPAQLADETLSAMQEEYENLEADRAVETIAGLPAVGHDMEFFLFDLVNTAWTRCLSTSEGALLLLGQCTDDEVDSHGVVMRGICASLKIED